METLGQILRAERAFRRQFRVFYIQNFLCMPDKIVCGIGLR